MSDQENEPKIVVDEDWKSRVRAEREAARKARTAEPSAAEPADGAAAGRIPPASFEVLISTLMAQALTAMGKLPDPLQGHPVVRPDLAKHYIDMLGMLEEKTKGNLTPEEQQLLKNTLSDLRMGFVSVANQLSSSSEK